LVGSTEGMKEHGAERVGGHGQRSTTEKDPSRERALLRQRMGVLDGEEQKIQRGKKDEETS
jgi:hypothetical protein